MWQLRGMDTICTLLLPSFDSAQGDSKRVVFKIIVANSLRYAIKSTLSADTIAMLSGEFIVILSGVVVVMLSEVVIVMLSGVVVVMLSGVVVVMLSGVEA